MYYYASCNILFQLNRSCSCLVTGEHPYSFESRIVQQKHFIYFIRLS